MKIFIPVVVALLLFSCQPHRDFERKIITAGNTKIEILTAYDIFDTYAAGNLDYYTGVYHHIVKEFSKNARYGYLLDFLQSEMRIGKELKEELRLMKKTDFAGITKKNAWQSHRRNRGAGY